MLSLTSLCITSYRLPEARFAFQHGSSIMCHSQLHLIQHTTTMQRTALQEQLTSWSCCCTASGIRPAQYSLSFPVAAGPCSTKCRFILCSIEHGDSCYGCWCNACPLIVRSVFCLKADQLATHGHSSFKHHMSCNCNVSTKGWDSHVILPSQSCSTPCAQNVISYVCGKQLAYVGGQLTRRSLLAKVAVEKVLPLRLPICRFSVRPARIWSMFSAAKASSSCLASSSFPTCRHCNHGQQVGIGFMKFEAHDVWFQHGTSKPN